MPIHWSGANSSGGRIGALVHGETDPWSGQPDSKATRARVSALAVTHYGFVLTRGNPSGRLSSPLVAEAGSASPRPAGADAAAPLAYWARAPFADGTITFVALDATESDARGFVEALLPEGDRLTIADEGSGLHRAATLVDGRLETVVFLGHEPTLPSPEWLKSRFAATAIAAGERRALLAGRPVEGAGDDGPVVCVCYQVGQKRIAAAIAAGAASAEDVGCATRAGTNCGSCVPELKRMLGARARLPDAAE